MCRLPKYVYWIALIFTWPLLLAACVTPQQRMKDCNADAQGLKGEVRTDFLKECLKK